MRSFILCALFLALAMSQGMTCPSGQVFVKFIKQTGSYASEESWELYSGGAKIYTSPTLENNAVRTIEKCIPASTNNQYTLKMLDNYGDSWANEAFLQIEGPYGNRIFKRVLFQPMNEEYPLSLYTPIMKSDSWKFTSGSVAGDWTQYNFADGSWSQVTLGSVTTPASGTQYFRKTFAGLAGMAAYEVRFNYRFGIVAYINGVEIYRDNMPAGPVTGSTLAAGSYPSVEYHAIIRPGVEVANSQSVLAVEIHFITAAGQTNVDFDSFLAIYASSTPGTDPCYSYAYDMSLTSSSGSNVNQMIDYANTYYYVSGSSNFPAHVTFTMPGPKAYFNGVSIWPYSNPTASPNNFVLQGADSATATTWTDVVVANGLLYENNVVKNANGYFNAGLYNSYRYQFNAPTSTTYYYVYEAYPLVCATAIPTSIEFEQPTYSFYAKYDEVTIKPKLPEFTSCTINPQPAAGLTFDATTCTLSGISTTAATTQYTVSSIMNGQTYTGSFTLQLTDCSGSIIKAVRTYGSNSVYEGFTIRDAATQNVVLQVTPNSGQVNNEEWFAIACLTGTKYIASVSSSSYSYWQSNSFLYINAMLDSNDDYETILRAKYDINLGLPTSYTFNAQYSIKSFESWNYKMGEVPANWYGSDMAGWATGMSGSFPESTNQIQLYKKTFNVASLNDVAGVVISFKYQYGYIIYLNNREVARKGFTGDLSPSTYSTTSLTNSNFRHVTLPIKTLGDTTSPAVDYITTGMNTIAIGLVSMGPGQKASTFDAAVRLMGANSVSRVWKTTQSYTSLYGSPTSFMNFYHGNTIYYSTCSSNFFQVSFDDDRREWISSVVFRLYYTQGDQHPKNVVIKAKNPEDADWTTLKTVQGMTWSLAGQSNRVWLTNNKAYNQYRFENFATGSTTDCAWKLGMIDLRSDSTTMVVPALSYPATTSIFKDIEMAEVYANSDYFTDYTVNPPLPAGVNLDPYTGTISGMATAITGTQTYTISAKKYNTGELVTAQMSLAVEVCTGGKSLITLVVRSDSYPADSSWKLYQGKGVSGTVLQSVNELPISNGLSYGDFCLNHGIYTLEFKDTTIGWNTPAGYFLSVDVGAMKFEMGQVYSETAPTSVTTMFSSFLPFQIEYDDWKVFKDGAVAENWKAIDFDDSAWTVTKAANIGTNQAITTYIRRDITLDDVNNYQVLNIRVKYAGGVVAYFNGRKVARFNLNDEFDAETESMAVHDADTFSMFHIVLPTVGAVNGKNVIAFEIHRPLATSSAEPVVFDATGVFGVNDCSPGVDTVINVSGSPAYTIGDLENFFDLTPVTYGYQANSAGTYLQWTVENLEGTRFNSFALETHYSRSNWAFSLYGRETESLEEDDPNAEEYLSMFAETGLSTLSQKRSAYNVPVGIAGFRQFKHEYDTAAYYSSVYISAYILQYCKAQGSSICPGIDDYPPVGEGQISPAECGEGYRGYSYRICAGGTLGQIMTDKCIYKVPAKLRYGADRYMVVLNTEISIPAPTYQNVINRFYLAENTYLPNGLVLNEVTGAVSGKPTEETGLRTYTIYGENPSGVVSTELNIQVRKGECRAEGNFPKAKVGEVATYECSVGGAYIGTQKRACLLGEKDGEWQKIQGTCMPVFMIVFLVLIIVVVLGVVGYFIVRLTKKTKAVGGVKAKKSKSSKAAPKKGSKKAVKV